MPLAEHCVTQYPTSSNLTLVFARIASQHIVVSTFARFPSPSEATEQVTEELWHAITENDAEPALVSYKIAEKDTLAPFLKRFPRISAPRRTWSGFATRARESFSLRNST
jgi:hypothetical protein